MGRADGAGGPFQLGQHPHRCPPPPSLSKRTHRRQGYPASQRENTCCRCLLPFTCAHPCDHAPTSTDECCMTHSSLYSPPTPLRRPTITSSPSPHSPCGERGCPGTLVSGADPSQPGGPGGRSVAGHGEQRGRFAAREGRQGPCPPTPEIEPAPQILRPWPYLHAWPNTSSYARAPVSHSKHLTVIPPSTCGPMFDLGLTSAPTAGALIHGRWTPATQASSRPPCCHPRLLHPPLASQGRPSRVWGCGPGANPVLGGPSEATGVIDRTLCQPSVAARAWAGGRGRGGDAGSGSLEGGRGRGGPEVCSPACLAAPHPQSARRLEQHNRR